MFSACNAAWPRRPERRELSVIKIRSSMPPAAYQRLDANPTIHMQMRFLGSTIGIHLSEMRYRVTKQGLVNTAAFMGDSSLGFVADLSRTARHALEFPTNGTTFPPKR